MDIINMSSKQITSNITLDSYNTSGYLKIVNYFNRKMVIKKIDHYDYLLQDGKKKNYMINIQFYDINTIIEVNDILYIDEKLLKEKMLYKW